MKATELHFTLLSQTTEKYILLGRSRHGAAVFDWKRGRGTFQRFSDDALVFLKHGYVPASPEITAADYNTFKTAIKKAFSVDSFLLDRIHIGKIAFLLNITLIDLYSSLGMVRVVFDTDSMIMLEGQWDAIGKITTQAVNEQFKMLLTKKLQGAILDVLDPQEEG